MTWLGLKRTRIYDISGLCGILQSPAATGTRRPLVCLTLALNYALGGLEPWSYHVVNLAIHACAALVLFGIVRRTLQGPRLRERFGTPANGLAAAIAILWAVHPMQTESVTYVIQRMESLMGLFLLLTLYCVIRGHDSPRRLWWFAGAVACCALGMATKEGMATAPIIVLLYDRVFLADSWADLSHKRSRLYIGLAATWLILISLIVVNKARGGTLLGFPAVSWWRYAQNQFGATAHYFRLAFWPDRLCIDYGWQISTLPRSWIAVGAMLVVWLVGCNGMGVGERAAAGFFGRMVFSNFGAELKPRPDSRHGGRAPNVFAVGGHGDARCNSCLEWPICFEPALRTHTSCVGWACFALTALVAGALAWRTAERNQDYHSGIAIWTNTIRERPQNGRAWNNLG